MLSVDELKNIIESVTGKTTARVSSESTHMRDPRVPFVQGIQIDEPVCHNSLQTLQRFLALLACPSARRCAALDCLC